MFLAALLTTEELQYDEPYKGEHCGQCRACLDACPTGALVEPRRLDARKCISYLTIELRGPIHAELREKIGNRVFGCDVCQQVCPWNRRSAGASLPAFQPREGLHPVHPAELLTLDDEAFRARFRHTPLWRAKRRGILRNAAIALGNCGSAATVPVLKIGLSDQEALVRAACAWALGQHCEQEARCALANRLPVEPDAIVRDEITAALQRSF